MLNVTDDSGLLALVVPATYETFVASDWTLSQILAHFTAQMSCRALLIWGTGLSGFWEVDVRLKLTELRGFREVSGPLHVAGGSLLLTNYESLTMAAQFNDVTLPEKHQADLLVSLPDGEYKCRIIQMFDPEREETARDDKPDFIIELEKTNQNLGVWKSIPWFEIGGKATTCRAEKTYRR
jgi:hypothetical protein